MGSQRADAIVGRRRELDALTGWLDGARHSKGRLVLCSGDPGIGKSRLAQELAGVALAQGSAVAWGRCAQDEGAPPFWPWRQVLRGLAVDTDSVMAGEADSPEDRFQIYENVSSAVLDAAAGAGLVVILDDIHWADESSLRLLRHLAQYLDTSSLLVFGAFRAVEPGSALPRVLPDLVRAPAAERIELQAFDLAEVREQLERSQAPDAQDNAPAVFDLTAGNPLFVREIAHAMADGSWRPDRPPRTIVDVVLARLAGVAPDCRRFLQAASVVGREFSVALVARAIDRRVAECLPLVDEAITYALLDRVGDANDFRFVHALTREAVEASLTTAERVELHRAVALAMEEQYAANLDERAAEIARHWAELAPFGEGDAARAWTIRAAADAVRRLAFEDGVRLYRAVLALPAPPLPADEQCRVLIALARAAAMSGELQERVRAATEAAAAARSAGAPELLAEAVLVLEAVPDGALNAVTKQLCEVALDALGDAGDAALRARLLAQRSRLAFYDAEQERVQELSAAALDLARASGDDRAVVEALHARREACPGPAGRAERMAVADEMITVGRRTDAGRAAMWGQLWRIDALMESGRISDAEDELAALEVAVRRAGGPVSEWHLDRTAAFVAQAQGRYGDAALISTRAFERMSIIEHRPARGAYFALQCALARHVGATDASIAVADTPFEPLPLFRTMGALSRTLLLLAIGRVEDARASFERAGPVDAWIPPPFHELYTYACGTLAAADLERADVVAALIERLEPFRGEHAVAEGVAYMGPVELALGRGALALGRMDRAVEDLTAAAATAERAGARGFAAEARAHLARAQSVDEAASPLSARELEVAGLVAGGLTNRQIAEHLVISERTAQNHVQHILTKLGFSNRSQIAAWVAGNRG